MKITRNIGQILLGIALLCWASSCSSGLKEEDMTPVIELSNMNVVYVGVDNPVRIAIPGMVHPKIDIVIKEGEATFTPDSANGYGAFIVSNAKMGNNIVFDVNAEVNGTMKTLGQGKFRVKPLPNVKLLLGGKTEGPITVQEIGSYGLRVFYDENFPFKLSKEKLPEIHSWTIGNNKEFEISGTGKIEKHPELIDWLNNKAHNGDKIWIEALIDLKDGKMVDGEIMYRPWAAAFEIKK